MSAYDDRGFAEIERAAAQGDWEEMQREQMSEHAYFQITEPDHLTEVLCAHEKEWNALLVGRDAKLIGEWLLKKLDAQIDKAMDEAIAEKLQEAA